MLTLPPETNLQIVTQLRRKDQLAFSLVSRAARELALPTIFGEVKFKRARKSRASQPFHLREALIVFICAGQNVKDAVRTLSLDASYYPTFFDPCPDNRIIFFRLLRSLRNLQSLSFERFSPLDLSDVATLVETTLNAPLRHLSLEFDNRNIPGNVIVSGPAGLETLTVGWDVDGHGRRGSSLAHLYELIQPSLETLTVLKLYLAPAMVETKIDFDLAFLKPAGTNMRVFRYKTYFPNPDVLRILPEIFPNLRELVLTLDSYDTGGWAVWNNEYLDYLALFQNLTHLGLSFDLEVAADDTLDEDHDLAWYRRCLYRRLDITERMRDRCPLLQRCEWLQFSIDSEGNDGQHHFVILEEVRGAEKVRVVKPVVQWWMAARYKDEHGGELPHDMVKENAWWEFEIE